MSGGRPAKNNAEYFPHYNNLRNHRKVRAIRNRFGQALGLAFWCLILEWLIEHDGLEFEYSEMEVEMLAVELGISAAELRELVDYCIKLELLFLTDSNFLYSESLNEKLAPVFEKRHRERERSRDRQRRENGQFQPKKSHTLGVTAAEKPQSKVKKSKEEKSKSTNVNKGFSAYDFSLPFESEEFREVWKMFCDHRKAIKSPLTHNAAKLVVIKLSKVEERYAKFMLEKTIEGGKYPTVYDLKDWEMERIDKQSGIMSSNAQAPPKPIKRNYLNDLPEFRNPNPTIFWPGEITDLPFTSEEFKTEWGKWSDMITNKKPETPRISYEENLKTLGSKPEPVAIEMLKRAIKGGFNQIYELKPDEEKVIMLGPYEPADDDERRLKSKYDLYPDEVWIEFKERKKWRKENSPPGGDNWGSCQYPAHLSIYHEIHGLVGEIKKTTASKPSELKW